MTLILSCLTPSAVYQVSDRRITNLLPPGDVMDDEQNKAVMIGSRFAFAYNGLSEIAGECSDTWLARVISESDTNDMAAVVNHIRTSANDAFQRITGPKKNRRHAFHGVGWLRLKGESDLSPASLTIHNAIDPLTWMWLPEAKDEFQLNTQLAFAVSRLLRNGKRRRNTFTRREGSCVQSSAQMCQAPYVEPGHGARGQD